jgi:hypothetical protein
VEEHITNLPGIQMSNLGLELLAPVKPPDDCSPAAGWIASLAEMLSQDHRAEQVLKSCSADIVG